MGSIAEWVSAIVPLLYMFFGSVLALYIKDKLKDINITLLQQEARLKDHQTQVKEDLQMNQNELKQTLIGHVAEDVVQFKHIRNDSRAIWETLKDIRDALRSKRCE